MINNEQVKHIADLAKLDIKEEEMEKYKKQLSDILTEIEKIVDVNIDNDIMISPTDNENNYEDDKIEPHISRDLAFINAKRIVGDYIVVPNVIERIEQ